MSGPLPSTSGLVSTCFKAVTQNESDSKLADQLRSWYELESFAAMKQVDPRSASDARASKILQETTYHDGCRYQVGMLLADDEGSLPNNYFSDLVQLKSLEATKKAQDLVEMLAKGGFKLTKFASNVPKLVNSVDPNSQPTESTEKVLATDKETSHVLGLKWNHSRDTLVVSRGTTPDLNRPLTQRVVLSLVSAVYDPIGLVAPYTVTARLLLKDIWRLSGQQWDNNMPENVCKKFLEWAEELPNLSEIAIPRC